MPASGVDDSGDDAAAALFQGLTPPRLFQGLTPPRRDVYSQPLAESWVSG
jgi:hypothetical protein